MFLEIFISWASFIQLLDVHFCHCWPHQMSARFLLYFNGHHWWILLKLNKKSIAHLLPHGSNFNIFNYIFHVVPRIWKMILTKNVTLEHELSVMHIAAIFYYYNSSHRSEEINWWSLTFLLWNVEQFFPLYNHVKWSLWDAWQPEGFWFLCSTEHSIA